jgi:hypothetical protein
LVLRLLRSYLINEGRPALQRPALQGLSDEYASTATNWTDFTVGAALGVGAAKTPLTTSGPVVLNVSDDFLLSTSERGTNLPALYNPIYDKPIEIAFQVSRRATANMTEAQRVAFTQHLAEQESWLNYMSIYRTSDLELNLLNYRNITSLNDAARRIAAQRLGGAGTGLDAAHGLDAIAGGYMHNIPALRDPVQRTIGSLWKENVKNIQPGRYHKLVPVFTE